MSWSVITLAMVAAALAVTQTSAFESLRIMSPEKEAATKNDPLSEQQRQEMLEPNKTAVEDRRQVLEIYGKQSVDRDFIEAVASGRESIEHVIPLDRVPVIMEQFGEQGPLGQQVSNELDISMVLSAAKKQPPVYMSAPKQIEALNEISQHDSSSRALSGESGESPAGRTQEVSRADSGLMKKHSLDLHTAADGHYHKNKKSKKMKLKRKKKKKKKKKKPKKKRHSQKKKKKPKKKKVKIVLVKKPSYEHQPKGDSHLDHYGDHTGYYEYREVPKKGAWKYGYKRGNKMHTIERKEHGHKSHFKTEVNWQDKKGKGMHVFDYKHHDKKKKKKKRKKHAGHYAAAATNINGAKSSTIAGVSESI